MKKAYGITPASFTAWDIDGKFDQTGMENYITWMIDNGVQSLSFCGSTGENITQSIEEQKHILEVCIKYVDGQIPVYAGTGRYSTEHTIELSKYAQECGADGCMIILPYYLAPYKAAVLDHFRAIRAAIDIDIMVYNNPWFAGYQLDQYEVETLYREKAIQSIKCAHGDPAYCTKVKMHTGDDFGVFYGHDYAGAEALLFGADGWLSAWPALFPKHCREIYDAAHEEHNCKKAFDLVKKMLPIRDLFLDDNENGKPHWQEKGKYILELQGLQRMGTPRKPLGYLTEDYKKKIQNAMIQSGCL